MDNQALIRTYGNTDLPNGMPDRPLVTFAVFAFNQEKYIRDAVEGAFSQTYTPLEILLSDDDSNDRTFSIIQSMAEQYSGRHRIRIIKHLKNNGTVNHIIRVARLAYGDLIVAAAGDDISYPERTQKIVECWLQERPSCIVSKFDEIDTNGSILGKDRRWGICQDTQRIFGKSMKAIKNNGAVANVVGFSAAYPRDFWAKMPLTSKRLLIEDGLATCIINASGGKIKTVDCSLVAYRIHCASLSNRRGEENREALKRREYRISWGAQDTVDRVDYIIQLHNERELDLHHGDRKHLLKEKRYGVFLLNFWNDPPLQRIAKFTKVRSLRELKFIAPRMFGFSFFHGIRVLSRLLSGPIKK